MTKKLLILTFHRVLNAPDPLRPGEISVDYFRGYVRVLSKYFNVLPLREALHRLSNSSLPSRAVCITFDDGYADNHQVAWPVLQEYEMPATVFVATGFLGGGRMWNDTVIESVRRIRNNELDLCELDLGCYAAESNVQRVVAIKDILRQLKYMEPRERESRTAELAKMAGGEIPSDLMMEANQVKELCDAGIEIGAHTVTHPILKSTDLATARDEIFGGKDSLEEIVGTRVRSFAYPNGQPGVDYDTAHVDLVREAGFDYAVSTSSGVASAASDILQLPRFGPWAESPTRFGLRLLRLFFSSK